MCCYVQNEGGYCLGHPASYKVLSSKNESLKSSIEILGGKTLILVQERRIGPSNSVHERTTRTSRRKTRKNSSEYCHAAANNNGYNNLTLVLTYPFRLLILLPSVE